MKIKILGSGSKGNCVVVTDNTNNQILLDCGIPFMNILLEISILNVDLLLLSHEHKDHSLSYNNFKNLGIKRFSYENEKQVIETLNYKVMPIELRHNVKCYGYLIYSKQENKQIAYITDTTYIPKFKSLDCLILDINYSNIVVDELSRKYEKINLGHKNHNSLENTQLYFSQNDIRIKNLIAYHLSNSGLQNENLIKKTLSCYVDKLYIAKKNLEIII